MSDLYVQTRRPVAREGYLCRVTSVHLLKAELAYGGFLPPKAKVHHLDGNNRNNQNSNLVICEDHEYHMLLHARLKALRGCGNPAWRKCTYCKKWDAVEHLYIGKKRMGGGRTICHMRCAVEHKRNVQTTRRSFQP